METDASKAVLKWEEAFSKSSMERIVIVWDCLKMTGYDHEARNLWQHAMNRLKNRIDCIWLITHSAVIKIGARVLSVMSGFRILIVSHEDEIIFTGYDGCRRKGMS